MPGHHENSSLGASTHAVCGAGTGGCLRGGRAGPLSAKTTREMAFTSSIEYHMSEGRFPYAMDARWVTVEEARHFGPRFTLRHGEGTARFESCPSSWISTASPKA